MQLRWAVNAHGVQPTHITCGESPIMVGANRAPGVGGDGVGVAMRPV
eukprot:CAMPEP_0181215552 /NCGR_PEP_ID=MMETSP1096-20121128/26077_1 /TAXON_ID=156174 ORGANISM="Chrysochromulina ericina, Strain CCMP281" /NCGR_SAMPLE_ID=MMETSP1096 /ASSEMBLY_ACC=CAM_ASM_000453 /LENGTH=46 /DNA_ID= /DNA_START= /DNA_END= /DNA_ORIENTATION=